MNISLLLKAVGIGLATFVFFHLWAIYGLLLGVGVGLMVLA